MLAILDKFFNLCDVKKNFKIARLSGKNFLKNPKNILAVLVKYFHSLIYNTLFGANIFFV